MAVLQIQVMLPQVSAQRQHDQQYTASILSLPVVIAVVPAGSLPSALPLTSSLLMPHSPSAKMQTKRAGPDWKTQGKKYNRGKTHKVLLDIFTKNNTDWHFVVH